MESFRYEDTSKVDKPEYVDYVCPCCFHRAPECSCSSMEVSGYLIWIDRNMQDIVRILNEKGYRTRYCCESHGCHGNMYVRFSDDYVFDVVPDGFKYKNGVIDHTYTRSHKENMNDEEFEKEKRKHLKLLFKWADNLPSFQC